MSRLNIKVCNTQPSPYISVAISKVLDAQQLTTEGLSEEMSMEVANNLRTVISMLGESHPYLRYCSAKDFTNAELLERQTEIVTALGAGLKAAFGTIASAGSRVANSSRFIPGWFKWTGLGTNWGSVVGNLTFISAIETAVSKMDKATNFDSENLSDRDGLTTKRAMIPENQQFTLKDAKWQGKGPITALDVADQMDNMVAFLNALNKMTDALPSVVSGKMKLDSWLDMLKVVNTSGANTWVVGPLHKNVGFTVYKNGDKYFLEKVTGTMPLSENAIIPPVKDMMWIQKAAKNMDKSARTLNKNLEKTLKKLSDGEKETSTDASFAYRALKSMFEDTVPLAKDMLRDGKYFIDDSIAAIMSYRVKEE